MPKPLREAPPSSSVARLLDVDAASRALSATSARTGEVKPDLSLTVTSFMEPRGSIPLPSPHGSPGRESASIKREFILTAFTDETFTRLVELYRRSTSTRLSSSHVFRAMLRGFAASMDSLQHEAAKIGRLKLPGNAAGREQERERFEERIAETLVNGMRSAATYRRRGD